MLPGVGFSRGTRYQGGLRTRALGRAGQGPASQTLALARRGHARLRTVVRSNSPGIAGPSRASVLLWVAADVPGSSEDPGSTVCRSGPSPSPRRAPATPPPQPRAGATEHTRALPHARTAALRAPAPALPLGGDPPRRQPRLRLPACVYNFVLPPRPPCSCKGGGGGGMWKAAAAARRLTGASSGGLRRRPERPLVAVPRARSESCVLPPRP